MKLMDQRLFKCPLKKGKYVLVSGRSRDYLKIININEDFPAMMPLSGKYYLMGKIRTVVDRKFVSLINFTEVFEFVN